MNAPIYTPTPQQRLMWALQDRNMKQVRLALQAGADPNYHRPDGCTPLQYLVRQNISARLNKTLACMQILLTGGADINCRDEGGNTALHYAIHAGQDTEIYDFMLASGSDINAVNNDGSTPLHWALNSPKTLVFEDARYLLDRGADPTIKNRRGVSLAGWAERGRHDSTYEAYDRLMKGKTA